MLWTAHGLEVPIDILEFIIVIVLSMHATFCRSCYLGANLRPTKSCHFFVPASGILRHGDSGVPSGQKPFFKPEFSIELQGGIDYLFCVTVPWRSLDRSHRKDVPLLAHQDLTARDCLSRSASVWCKNQRS